MRPDRRRLLIMIALVVLLGAVGWSYLGAGEDAPATAPAAGGPRRPAATGPGTESLPAAESVRLSALPQARGEPEAATRNPFKFDRRTTTQTTEKPPVFAVAPASPTEPAGGARAAAPPPIPLKFIGVVEKSDGDRWAVLSVGEGRAPLHGKEGDIIDGRYRILKIGAESIDMVYLDGRGRQTIKLTGQ
jgi:hypothetical protein